MMNCCNEQSYIVLGDLKFKVTFSENDASFCVKFDEIYRIKDYKEKYPGPYEITPTDNIQVLETEDKLMEEDLIIKAAPIAKATITGTLLELIGNFPIEVLGGKS